MIRCYWARYPNPQTLAAKIPPLRAKLSPSDLIEAVWLRRWNVNGVDVLVECWPDSVVPHPLALARAAEFESALARKKEARA